MERHGGGGRHGAARLRRGRARALASRRACRRRRRSAGRGWGGTSRCASGTARARLAANATRRKRHTRGRPAQALRRLRLQQPGRDVNVRRTIGTARARLADAFSNHKTILKAQQVSPIRYFTFLNTILMLEILKSFIHECLCFTSCKAHPHKIHDRLQQRQIMIGCSVFGG